MICAHGKLHVGGRYRRIATGSTRIIAAIAFNGTVTYKVSGQTSFVPQSCSTADFLKWVMYEVQMNGTSLPFGTDRKA